MSSVGQAITGIAGAAIGSMIPGVGTAYGAFMGFGIGLTIGGILFPPSMQQEQPRPMNLMVQTSQVGLPIPIVYGSRKAQGNLIYYGDFQSHAQTQEVGGKGGSTTVTTGYTYSVTMAWGLCLLSPGNTKGVVNCWAGKNLVDPGSYIVYNGSQTGPDPTIAALIQATPQQPAQVSISLGEHAVTSGYSLEGDGVEVLDLIAVIYLTVSSVGTDGTVDIKIQDSDDNLNWADWTGGGFTQVTQSNYANQQRQYTGGKQYVRVVAQVGTATSSFGVTIAPSDPKGARVPVWKNLCYVVMPNYNLGASGIIPQFTFEMALENAGFNRADGDSEGFVAEQDCVYCGGALYGTDIHYSSGLDKVVAISSYTGAGNKSLCGIFICSPDDLTIEKAFTAHTDPGYSQIFPDNHRWPHSSRQDSSSKWICVLGGNSTIMMLDAESDEIKYIQLYEEYENYGLHANVTGLEAIITYFGGSANWPAAIYADYRENEGRVYLLLNSAYPYAMNMVFGYVEFNESTTVYPFTALVKFSYYDAWDLAYFQSMLYVPEKQCVAMAWTSLHGEGRLLVFPLDGTNVPLHRFDQTTQEEGGGSYPSSGITSQMCYLDGKIWGGFTADEIFVGQWQPEQKGLLSIDLDTYAIGVSFAPDFADVDNYGFDQIIAMGSTLLMGSASYGIVTYNPSSYVWTVHDNNTNPGLDPGGNYNDFPVVAYRPNGTLYAGSFYPWSAGWSGVVMLGGYSAGDVNPVDVEYDVMTNPMYGIGFDASLFDAAKCADTHQYCEDNDLLVSFVFSTQASVLDTLAYVLQHHNGFISYFDGKIAIDQFRHTEPTETISDANNDFVEDTDFPITIAKGGERDYFNKVQVQYTKRAAEYADGIALADDIVDIDTYGLKDTSIKMDGLCTYARGEKMSWVYLKKSLLQPQKLQIKLGPKSKLKITPGAMVGITDTKTELNALPIRISTISEGSDGVMDVEAVEENAAIYDYDMSAAAEDPNVPGTDPNLRDPAESVVHPAAFLIDSYYSGTDRVVYVEYSQPPDNPSWAGASVYRAYSSSGPYERLVSNTGSGVIGVAQAVGELLQKAYVDVLLDIDFTLSSAANEQEFQANMARNLFWVKDKGYGRFKTATLIGEQTWRLTDLYWLSTYGYLTNTYGDIAEDDIIVFAAGTVNEIYLKDYEAGITLYFKCPSFNFYGEEQSLAECIVIPLVIPAAASAYLTTESGDALTTEGGDNLTT